MFILIQVDMINNDHNAQVLMLCMYSYGGYFRTNLNDSNKSYIESTVSKFIVTFTCMEKLTVSFVNH